MHGEERYLDPGVWNAGEYLLRQGVGALASVKQEKFAVTATSRWRTIACRLHALQLAASSRLIGLALPMAACPRSCASIMKMQPC